MPARQWLLGHKWKILLTGLLIGLSAATASWRVGSDRLKAADAPDPDGIAKVKHDGTRPSYPRTPEHPRTSKKPPPSGCWIYTHMNKSGGSTIKAILAKHLRNIRASYRVYSQLLYGEGEERLKEFLRQHATVIAGGYTEAFRPLGAGEDCKWFTMFRHPISRVISAYFYCKSVPSELLCGTAVMKANETDIYTFAEHWGNYGLRQFALSFVDQDDLLSIEVEDGLCTPECPAWYRAKLYFEALHANSSQPEKPFNQSDPLATDVAMATFVEPVKNLLSTRYAAVGILEEWEKSMVLFDHALELPQLSWSKSSSHSTPKNKGSPTFSDEKHELMSTAWTDERLTKSVALDILLYDHAVGVYQQQLKDYGLVE